MPSVRFRQRILWTVALLALSGCGGVSRLDSNAPRTVDLNGTWLLSRAASDDPQKLFEKLRPKPEIYRRGMGPDDGTGLGDDTGQSVPGPQGGGSRGGGRRSQQQAPSYASTRNYENFVRAAVSRALSAALARGDQVRVRQTAEAFSLDYGTTVRTFTPGGLSVVSADWGVADQSSGWRGKDYVIQIKPQTGVAQVEKYSLSDDGKHLVEELRLGGGDFPVVQLKRVYEHTESALPRAFPTND